MNAGLPVALLAFMLQVMAPSWAAQSMAGDLLADAPICGHETGGSVPAPVHDHDMSCAACLVCCVAHQTLPAASLVLPPPRVQDLPQTLLLTAASPRGPPRFQPKARDPPASV